MNILSLIFKEKKYEAGFTELKYQGNNVVDDKVLVDAGWYQEAMKHYCGICEQWFKTASIATHNRFKHK